MNAKEQDELFMRQLLESFIEKGLLWRLTKGPFYKKIRCKKKLKRRMKNGN